MPVRWIMCFVVGLLLVSTAARADFGTCYTGVTPMSDPVLADCADETNCSLPGEVQGPSPMPPAGPRCWEAGATCRPGLPALPVSAEALPILLAQPALTPRWSPSLLPPLEAAPFVAMRCERSAPPPVPPPRG